MEDYVNNFKNFEESIVYNFTLHMGGIGDFLKFFMIILTHCMDNNIRIYRKINNLEIEKYIKSKYDFFDITSDEIEKLNNVTIKVPQQYYRKVHYNWNVNINEVFYFDDSIKLNIKNILPTLPTNYISIHLRMGDKFLEINKELIAMKNDARSFSKENLYKIIEDNSNKNIIFFCDNNSYKLEIKNKYKNIIITNAQIGHTSYTTTTAKEVLDTITELYLLSNSQLIYAASASGFSKTAAMFKNVEYIGGCDHW